MDAKKRFQGLFHPAEGKMYEVLFIICCIFAFVLFFRSLLFTAQRMFSHDTIWYYGIFHYLSDSLMNGFFPYWDPYDYCGQPFYPHLSIMHLVNPITISVILLNKFMRLSLLTLYHWHFMLEIVLANVGVYLVYRQVNKHTISNLAVFITFIFSSFTFISLRQAGFLYAFLWLPYSLWFLLRLIKKFNLYNIIGFGLFAGLSMTGYQGLLVTVFLMAFVLSLVLNKRDFFTKVFREPRRLGLVFVLVLIVGGLGMQLFSVYIDKENFVPMARMKTSPHETDSYEDRSGSVASQLNDFRGLIFRDIAARGYFKKEISLSEGFLYIGLAPLILAFIGIFLSKGEFKANFLFTLLFTALLMLGSKTRLQEVVNALFPPFKYVRHMQLLAGYFLFNLMYFVGMGCDYLIDKIKPLNLKVVLSLGLLLAIPADLISYGMTTFDHVTLARHETEFDEYPTKTPFGRYREERMVVDDEFRFYRPALYKKRTAFNACTIPSQFTRKFLRHGLYELYTKIARGEGFAFSEEAGEMGVRDFIKYGASEFPNWNKEDRLAFLDMLNIALLDFAGNVHFYECFEGFMKLHSIARNTIYLGYKETIREEGDWPARKSAAELLTEIIDLKMRIKPDSGSKTFLFIDKEVGFLDRLSFHGHAYNNIPVKGYLAYVWGANHVEEFTLLLSKDYRDIIRLSNRRTDARGAFYEKIREITGVSNEVILFYPRAEYLERDKIIERLSSSPEEDLLYLEAEDGRPEEDEPVGDSGNDIFEYTVKSYNPNDLELHYESSQGGFLYYSDGYDKYWKAFIDGKEATVYRANLAFKAVRIPPGAHTARFVYDPRIYKTALFVYYVFIALCIFYLIAAIASGKKSSRAR